MRNEIKCDLLVLGTGLAGFRAAISALAHVPKLDVLAVSGIRGPGGSSFANSNNALGMQVLETNEEKRQYVERARQIAAPGHFDPALAKLMAEMSHARYLDMKKRGLSFDAEGDHRHKKYNACFNHHIRCARIFRDLPQAYARYQDKAASLGLRIIEANVLDLAQNSHGLVQGAVLEVKGRAEFVRARAVVMAMGGPAKLYKWNMAARGASGLGLGIMAKAGVRLANAGFIQFMWNRTGTRQFVSPAGLAMNNAVITGPGRDERKFTQVCGLNLDELKDMAQSRLTHCPAAYGFPDNRLDKAMLENLDRDGTLAVRAGDDNLVLAPMAHAGNGGAVTDAQGRTSVKGLWAVGECATGMHGANRIGGGSVLSTQVFGHLAGIAAAEYCRDCPAPSPDFSAHQGISTQPDPALEAYIQDKMQMHAVFGGGPGLSTFHHRLLEMETERSGPDLVLVKSALAVTSGLRLRI